MQSPDPNESKERYLRLLKVESIASRKLGRKLQRLLWDMSKVAPTDVEFAISYLLFLRAERTFSSIRTLARMRMVDDAFALVRVLVEKVINGEYLLLAGTEPALDFIQYYAFREWRDIEDLQRVSPSLVPKYTAEHLDSLRRAHENAKIKTLPDGTQKSRYGRGHDWMEMGLSRRAEFVDKTLEARFSMSKQTSTQVLHYTAYKKAAGYLHGMWTSIARSVEQGESRGTADPNTVEVSFGIRVKDRDPRVASNALNSANLVAFALILFLDRVLMNRIHASWAMDFKRHYVLALKEARAPH